MNVSKRTLFLVSGSFLGGLLLGLIVFFPLQRLQNSLVTSISNASGLDIHINELKVGTGLGLGLSKGSLLALRARGLRLNSTQGKSLNCDQALVALHLWTFIIGRFQAAVWCEMDSNPAERVNGAMTVLISARPFWKANQISMDIDLNRLNLSHVLAFMADRIPTRVEAAGILSGEVTIKNLQMGERSGENSSPALTMNINAESLSLNQLEIMGAPLFAVPLSLGKTQIQASTDGPKIDINPISFLSDDLQGKMQMEITPGGPTGLQRMIWKGSIKTVRENPDRELVSLLTSNFGPIDPSGYRDFVKRVEDGNPAPLLRPPQE